MTEARYISTHGGEDADIEIQQSSTLFLVWPESDAGVSWIAENISEDAMFFGRALVCEHRFIEGLVAGMIGDGLVVKNQGRKLTLEQPTAGPFVNSSSPGLTS